MASIIGQFSAESIATTYGSSGVNAVFSAVLDRSGIATDDIEAKIFGDASDFGAHLLPDYVVDLIENGGGGEPPPTTGWIFPRGKA